MVNSDDVKEDLKELENPFKFNNYHKDFCFNSVYNGTQQFLSNDKFKQSLFDYRTFPVKKKHQSPVRKTRKTNSS